MAQWGRTVVENGVTVTHGLDLVVACDGLVRAGGNQRLHEAAPKIPPLLVRATSCSTVTCTVSQCPTRVSCLKSGPTAVCMHCTAGTSACIMYGQLVTCTKGRHSRPCYGG